MYVYILRNGDKFVMLQHKNRYTQDEFENLVKEYKYEYTHPLYTDESDIFELAKDLESGEGFIIVPMVPFF